MLMASLIRYMVRYIALGWTFRLFATEAVRLRKGISHGDQCQFLAHVPGAWHDEATITAEPSTILFSHGDVFVVEAPDRSRRYLVFRNSDGSCDEQAEQVCSPRPADAVASSQSDDGSTCAECSLGDADPPLSYVKSMIAGALQALDAPPSRLLSIGLGSGALAAWLFHNTEAIVDVAELSGGVVAAAPCFGLKSTPRLNLATADGRNYLEGSEGSYDAIFVDAFDASDTIPCALSTQEFFSLVQSKLNPNGVFSFNIVDKPPLAALLPTVQQVFSHVMVGSAPGLTNHIVVASQVDLSSRANTDQRPTTSWFQDARFQAVNSTLDVSHHEADLDATLRRDSSCASPEKLS